MKKLLLLLVLSLTFAMPSFAGWVITQTTTESGHQEEVHIWIEGSKVKYAVERYEIIFDQDDNTITMVDKAMKVYWKGTGEQFETEIKEVEKAIMDLALSKVPEEQRAAIKAMFEQSMAIEENESYNIEIVTTDETVEIAGYKSNKYLVKVEDKLTEELWIAEGFNPYKTINLDLFDAAVGNVSEVSEYSDELEYSKLLQKGYVMKKNSYDHDFGSSEPSLTEDVTSVIEEAIPGATFRPDDTYKLMNLADIIIERTTRISED